MSSPSGTLKIITFLWAPVSNSAGQTRFPMFSRIRRSVSPIACGYWASARATMSASMWQSPPLWICSASTPVASVTRCASRADSISTSMTRIRISSLRARISAVRSVVLPLPGLDMKLIMVVPAAVSMLRTAAAEASLSARTFSSIRIVRTAAISSSMSKFRTAYLIHYRVPPSSTRNEGGG